VFSGMVHLMCAMLVAQNHDSVRQVNLLGRKTYNTLKKHYLRIEKQLVKYFNSG